MAQSIINYDQLTVFHNKLYQMITSIRSSLGSHHTSLPSGQIEPAFDTQRIEKYLDYLKLTLRQRLKDRTFNFQENDFSSLYKLVKNIHNIYIRNQKENQNIVIQLRTQNEQMKIQLEDKIKKIKDEYAQELEEKVTSFNQKLLAVNNQSSRKEQAYKDKIEQLMTALSVAQKKYQNLQTKYQNQLHAITSKVQKVMSKHKKDQQLSVCIKQLVEEITLRQQNSFISSKPDQMSLDQIILNQQNHNESVIAADQFPQTSLEKQLQNYIIKLTCFGFFSKTNEECLKKMIAFTSNYQQPSQLLQEKVFPVILEVLTNNMRKYHKQGQEYFQGSPNSSQMEQNSRVELRNIINLSDLSINTASQISVNEIQFDEMNFKKKM